MGNSPGMYEAWRKAAGANPAAAAKRTFDLYIGADNDTGVVDTRRLHVILDECHEGYTVVPAFGRWNGKTELSVIVTVSDTRAAVMETVELIKLALQQTSIGIVTSTEMEFV